MICHCDAAAAALARFPARHSSETGRGGLHLTPKVEWSADPFCQCPTDRRDFQTETKSQPGTPSVAAVTQRGAYRFAPNCAEGNATLHARQESGWGGGRDTYFDLSTPDHPAATLRQASVRHFVKEREEGNFVLFNKPQIAAGK